MTTTRSHKPSNRAKPSKSKLSSKSSSSRSRRKSSLVAASLAAYVEYLGWRSYRDARESGDLRTYEDDDSLDIDELWSSYWFTWHQHMLYAAYAAIEDASRRQRDVLDVMAQGPYRYDDVIARIDPTRLPKLDHERRSRIFDGSRWVSLPPLAFPKATVVAASTRFWRRVNR